MAEYISLFSSMAVLVINPVSYRVTPGTTYPTHPLNLPFPFPILESLALLVIG
jgi:hypothetical protein